MFCFIQCNRQVECVYEDSYLDSASNKCLCKQRYFPNDKPEPLDSVGYNSTSIILQNYLYTPIFDERANNPIYSKNGDTVKVYGWMADDWNDSTLFTLYDKKIILSGLRIRYPISAANTLVDTSKMIYITGVVNMYQDDIPIISPPDPKDYYCFYTNYLEIIPLEMHN